MKNVLNKWSDEEKAEVLRLLKGRFPVNQRIVLMENMANNKVKIWCSFFLHTIVDDIPVQNVKIKKYIIDITWKVTLNAKI